MTETRPSEICYETRAQQRVREHDQYLKILRDEKVRSYLEIGSKFGGSLWRVARALPPGSRVVSVDLPYHSGEDSKPSLVACVDALRKLGYDARLYLGDSTSEGAVRFAESFGPYDACFVDANHTMPYVTRDWANYGGMSKIVAFHDIRHTKPIRSGRMPIDVPDFWASVREKYRHVEISTDPDENGIGVLWR